MSSTSASREWRQRPESTGRSRTSRSNTRKRARQTDRVEDANPGSYVDCSRGNHKSRRNFEQRFGRRVPWWQLVDFETGQDRVDGYGARHGLRFARLSLRPGRRRSAAYCCDWTGHNSPKTGRRRRCEIASSDWVSATRRQRFGLVDGTAEPDDADSSRRKRAVAHQSGSEECDIRTTVQGHFILFTGWFFRAFSSLHRSMVFSLEFNWYWCAIYLRVSLCWTLIHQFLHCPVCSCALGYNASGALWVHIARSRLRTLHVLCVPLCGWIGGQYFYIYCHCILNIDEVYGKKKKSKIGYWATC